MPDTSWTSARRYWRCGTRCPDQEIKSRIRKIIFNNYARFESGLQKVLSDATVSQSETFSDFKRGLGGFETRMSELETKLASQPDASPRLYAVVGKMKDQLKALVATAKGFDGMLGVIGGINLTVDFPTEQLEGMLAFKNENFIEQLQKKVEGCAELESPRLTELPERNARDLCEVLDALVNDDTQDRIQVANSDATQFYSQRTPMGGRRRREVESPSKVGPRMALTRPSEPELRDVFGGGQGSHAKDTMRRSTVLLPTSHANGLLRKTSLREIGFPLKEVAAEETTSNLRNVYDERTANRDYYPAPVPDRYSHRNDGGFTDDRNVYSKHVSKPKNALLYGSNVVTSARESSLANSQGPGLSVRRVTPKNNFVTVLSKAGYVSNQVIDETRLRDIVSSLRGLTGVVKQVEFSDNTIKCPLVATLRLACPDGLAFPVKIDFKRNKFVPPQVPTKKDKADMALLNIVLG